MELGDELGRTHDEIHGYSGATLTTARNSMMFALPPEMVMLVLQCLRVNDISRLDIAVSERGTRATFLTLIRSRQFTACAKDIGRSSNAEAMNRNIDCLRWMSHRGIHLHDLILLQGMESVIQPEQLVTLGDLKIDYDRHLGPLSTTVLMPSITSMCTMLTSLAIYGSPPLAWGHLEVIFTANTNIHQLVINNWRSGPVSLTAILQKCKSLASLSISGNWFTFDSKETILPIPSLIHLVIYSDGRSVRGFTDDCLIGLASATPNLETFNILFCSQLTHRGYNSLGGNWPRLRSLSVSNPCRTNPKAADGTKPRKH